MKAAFLLLLLSLNCIWLQAQRLVCSETDREAFVGKIREISSLQEQSYGDTLTAIGSTFTGIPYVAKTLEIGEKESLVINLQGLDCTTFVENVLAFGQVLRQGEPRLDAFADALETIRYKNGKLDGYTSRLHYFSEWIANNAEKGLLSEITEGLGGKPVTRDINFMSTHRELYPFLADEDNFLNIRASERYLNDQPLVVLAKDKIEAKEHLLQSGDIIALATSIEGLDVTHTGFAIRKENGRIHLLHASSSNGEVEISELPLAEYLKPLRKTTGIMVARPR